MKKYIPEKLYEQIIDNIPLCCVDMIVVCCGKFLLLKRTKSPANNQWWFPGGRLLRGEYLETAVKRKIQEELRIVKIKNIKFLAVGQNRFPNGHFGKPYFAVNIIYIVEIPNSEVDKIKIDKNHSEYRWFSKVPSGVYPYIKKYSKLAGFK